jgi:preprotein translocase subunit SecE
MSQAQVETVSTGADKLKVIGALALMIAGVVAFYALGQHDLWLRLVAMVALLAGAVLVFFTSETGKSLIAFGRESVKEAGKVVWPSRQEAGQMTLYVFGFVVIMALFLWVTDKSIEWVVFKVILGWK